MVIFQFSLFCFFGTNPKDNFSFSTSLPTVCRCVRCRLGVSRARHWEVLHCLDGRTGSGKTREAFIADLSQVVSDQWEPGDRIFAQLEEKGCHPTGTSLSTT